MPRKNKYTEEQIDEINRCKEACINVNLYKKFECLYFAAKGLEHKQISELTGYSESRISDFVREYLKNGIGYFLEEHRKGGNNRNLSQEDSKKILKKFIEKAEKGQVTSVEEIKKEYEEVCGKEVPLSSVYNLLRRENWRQIMPRSQHPKKADDEAIEASKKLTLK